MNSDTAFPLLTSNCNINILMLCPKVYDKLDILFTKDHTTLFHEIMVAPMTATLLS